MSERCGPITARYPAAVIRRAPGDPRRPRAGRSPMAHPTVEPKRTLMAHPIGSPRRRAPRGPVLALVVVAALAVALPISGWLGVGPLAGRPATAGGSPATSIAVLGASPASTAAPT